LATDCQDQQQARLFVCGRELRERSTVFVYRPESLLKSAA
jgi:hypothetical protein